MRGDSCFFITPIYPFQEGIQAVYGIHAVNVFEHLLYTRHCSCQWGCDIEKSPSWSLESH